MTLAAIRLKTACILALFAAAFAQPGHAGLGDNVRFVSDGVVMVWVDGEPVARGNRVVLGAVEAVASPLVPAGRLEPVAPLSPAGPSLEFQLASNTGYDIAIEWPGQADGHGLDIWLEQLATGTHARAPVIAPTSPVRLEAGPGPVSVYRSSVKTAARPGPPRQQAITFRLTLRGTDGALQSGVVSRLRLVISAQPLNSFVKTTD